jgi:hypothetical protein
MGIDVDGVIATGSQGEEEGASGDFAGDMGESKPLGYDGRKGEGNMTNASRGWGQPNALVVSGGCDKVLRVWEVKSGLVLLFCFLGHF